MKRAARALTDETFDLCIVGGGITGAGVALDAATRGWRVALIDRGDFASGTSSMSSKLVHGGLRYLEYGHFALVYEALQERGRLLRNAPHLVQPLPFILPFYEGQRIPAWKWRLGLTLYDFLAGRANIARSRRLSVSQIQRLLGTAESGRARLLPSRLSNESSSALRLGGSLALPSGTSARIRVDGLRGGALFYDALMDDARLCIAVLQTAARHGAALANYVEASAFEKHQGLIVAVQAKDHVNGKELTIRSRAFLNAAGPGADAVCRLAGDAASHLQPTKGVHLIVLALGHRCASLLLHPRDGRVFFVIPWLGKTLIGTTDTNPEDGSLRVLPKDVQYLLEGYNRYFTPTLETKDVMGSFVGLRPLIRAQPGAPSARSREFRILDSPTGLVTALGGKYTTFRRMAEEIVDHLSTRLGKKRRCRTHDLPLVGTPKTPWPIFRAEMMKSIQARFPIGADSADHLLHRYGDQVDDVLAILANAENGFERVHPEEPDLIGEQSHQRETEMALFADDFLLRRSRIGMWRPGLLK